MLCYLMILIGSGGLLWGFIPPRVSVREVAIQPQAMQVGLGNSEGSGIREVRVIRLESPKTVRIADQAKIELEFLPEIQGEGHIISEDPENDAYSDHSVVAEARIEVAGVEVTGPNPAQESLPAGQPIRFQWEIKAHRPGEHQGRIWLSLRFIPMDGTAPDQVPIYVHDITFRATSLLGMGGPLARILGGALFIAGSFVLAMDITLARRIVRERQQKLNSELK